MTVKTKEAAAEVILQGPIGPCPVCTDQIVGPGWGCRDCGHSGLTIRDNYHRACWILGIEFNPATQERILEEAKRGR